MIYRMSWIAVSLTMVTLIAGCGGDGGRQDVSATSTAVTPSDAVGPTQGQALLGDLDNDGNPTVGDAILILRIIVGLDPDNVCADANQSGGTDVGDAISVLRCLVGLDAWPIGICNGQQGLYSAYAVGASWVYEEAFDDGSSHNLTFTVAGTIDVDGTECIDLRIDDEGGTLAHAYCTVSETDGGYVHGLQSGGSPDIPESPSHWLPGNPPQEFSTTTDLFPLGGTYEVRAVSTAATVTTPAGTYDNAMQVELACPAPSINRASRMTIWVVPGIGIVRILLEFPNAGPITVSLVSYTPAS